MTLNQPNLISIQKLVCLLDDFHYQVFADHLKHINAHLPLKLCNAIRKKLPQFDSYTDLCYKIYGSKSITQIRTFHQLSSYTFKHLHVLAQNYPAYLQVNIPRLTKLVNDGHAEQTAIVAEALADISYRTGDLQARLWVLQFLAQEAYLQGNLADSLKYDEEFEEASQTLQLFNNLQLRFRAALRLPRESRAKLDEALSFFKQHSSHAYPLVAIYSRYAWLHITYHIEPGLYEEPEVRERIKAIEKDFINYPYLSFPFLSDIEGEFSFIKLNSPYTYLNTKDGKKQYMALSEHFDSVIFRGTYIHAAQINLMAIQLTRLITEYHTKLYRSDYDNVVTQQDRADIAMLLAKCAELGKSISGQEHLEHIQRRLDMMQAILLILSGGKLLKQGVKDLESFLITYQQINLKAATGIIYLCLMAGYFGLKDYERCVQAYSRFQKASKGKGVFKGNELKIRIFYYTAQWILTHGRQYEAKTQALIDENYEYPLPSLITMLHDCGMDIRIKK
jgi:hypothetical protein